MIIQFKIFERWAYEAKKKLATQLSEKFITKYYDKNYQITAQEIIELWPKIIWEFFDDEKFISEFIYDEIQNTSIDDYYDDIYKNFIIYRLTEKKKKKIIEIYKKQVHAKKGEKIDYEDDYIDILSEKQLKSIILVDSTENEFVEYAVKDRYEDESAQDIIENIYGENWSRTPFQTNDVLKILLKYVDENKMIDNYLNELDYTTKEEYVQECISSDVNLQIKLMKLKKSNAILLAKVFKQEKTDINISNKYEFQKLYIEEFVKSTDGATDDLKAKSLKYLYKNFGLNPSIEEEYKSDMWLVNIGKYNL
jgi:hypothetical protein